MERMSLDVNKMTKDQLRQHILMLAMQLTQLEEENKKLREELSAYDREYFDEDMKAQYIFMDDDTLQELRDLGAI